MYNWLTKSFSPFSIYWKFQNFSNFSHFQIKNSILFLHFTKEFALSVTVICHFVIYDFLLVVLTIFPVIYQLYLLFDKNFAKFFHFSIFFFQFRPPASKHFPQIYIVLHILDISSDFIANWLTKSFSPFSKIAPLHP